MIANATEVKNNFGHFLGVLDQEDVIIIKNGHPIARLCRETSWHEPSAEMKLSEEAAVYKVAGETNGEDMEPEDSSKRKLTFSKFIRLQDKAENRYEYIDGQAFLMAAPTRMHQRIVGHLHHFLYSYFLNKKCQVYLAPLDIIIGRTAKDKNVVQPDISVVCDLERFDEAGRYHGPPALVIEVTSMSSRGYDLLRKMDLYLRSGVYEYWVIDPDSQLINLYQFSNNQIIRQQTFTKDSEICSIYFEGLKLPAAGIFS